LEEGWLLIVLRSQDDILENLEENSPHKQNIKEISVGTENKTPFVCFELHGSLHRLSKSKMGRN
jgi:hypothetical protein